MAVAEADPRVARRRNAGSFHPSDEDRVAIRVMNERFKPDEPIRQRLEQQWCINIAFLLGMQYLSWDPVQRQLVYAQTPSLRWRARAIHNFIRPYVELEIATAGAFNPAFKVRPKNSDPENYNAAEANQDVVTHYWDATKMKRKRYDLLYWVKTTGNSWIWVDWDKCAGDPTHSNAEQVNLRGNLVNTVDTEFDGDISSTIESPFTIFYDMGAMCVEDVRWIIRARARPIEWVEQHFPDRADFVPLGIQNDGLITRQRWVIDIAGPGAQIGGSPQTDTMKDWVLVRELYEMPSIDFPHGRYIIDANGIPLEEPKDNPTPKGMLPCILVRDALVPGRVAGQCNVDNLINMQRSYNRMVSKKEEHIVLTANAKILEHASNDIPQSAWMTEIGEIIKWHGQQQPGYLIPPPMPPETDTELNRLRGDFDFVTRSFGPARGQYPGKVSGKAINYLVEQDQQNKTPMIDRLTENFEQWGTLVLETAQEYVVEPRLIKILGRNKQWSVKEFQGQDIAGNTEVSIDVESMVPKSRTMAMDLIIPMTQLGWLQPGNKQDKVRVWKSLGQEDDAPLTEDPAQDTRCARNENKQLMMGVMVKPAEYWEDQDMHMLIHAECAKGDEYKAAPGPIQDMLKAHMQSHIDIASPRVGVTVPPPEETGAEPAPQIGGGGASAAPAPMAGSQSAPMVPYT